MRSRFLNTLTARTVALAACAGVVGSFAMAAPAMAAAPGGAACQASDGKISGRGSTLQANAITAFITEYGTSVCGTVAAQYSGDPAGTSMLTYNYPTATAAGARGSGEGLAAMACRTDAFGGTDIPYNDGSSTPATGTMPWLWADVPSTGNPWPYFDPAYGSDGSDGCDSFYNTNGTTVTAWTPPYTPAPNAGCAAAGPACYPSTVGGVTNSAGPVMSFPVAVASAALGVDFKPNGTQIAGCPTAASQVQLSATEVSQIFSGTLTNWDQVTDAGTSTFAWSGCNVAITRIVRGDISGTTQEMKTYLRSVDGSRTLCDGKTWTTLASYNDNTLWPGASGDTCAGVTAPDTALGTGGGAACPTTFNATKGVICDLVITGGGITYGDLSNWKSTPDVIYAEVVPTSGTTGVIAGSSATLGSGTPNCDTSFSGNTPGVGGGGDFVGLDDTGGTPDEPSASNWATDGAVGSGGTTPPSDITNIPGSLKWPICTLTYDMVYAGLSGNNATYTANAIGGLTADQRRTIYTFFAFVLSPDGQAGLKVAGYLPLPSAWASAERAGFEAGF